MRGGEGSLRSLWILATVTVLDVALFEYSMQYEASAILIS